MGDDAFATTIIAPADHPSNQGDGGGGGGFASMFRRAGGQESSGGNQDTEGSGELLVKGLCRRPFAFGSDLL